MEASCPAATDFRSHVRVFRLGSNAALDRPGVLGGTIMLRLVAAALAVLTCTAPAFGEVASPQSPTPLVNCDGDAWRNRRLELAPSGEGPLALSSIYCQGAFLSHAPLGSIGARADSIQVDAYPAALK